MAGEEKCFTYFWKVENASYCHQKARDFIESPFFVVDDIGNTKWMLWLYPRRADAKNDADVICHLIRCSDRTSLRVEIKFEFALIAEDGSVLFSTDVKKNVFLSGSFSGHAIMAKRKDVLVTKNSIFSSHDTLIVRCRMWKVAGEMTENIRCLAHTRVEVEKKSFLWNIKNFKTLEMGKKISYQINSTQNDLPLMSVDLFLTKGLNLEETICFQLSLQDQAIIFSILGLFLLTSSGTKVECNQEEIWFDSVTKSKILTFTYTKKKLLRDESLYLPEDTLSLLWEFGFSRGVLSNEYKKDRVGCLYSEVKFANTINTKNGTTNLINCLVDGVKTLYDEQFLSDVKLRTNTSIFPAHKLILSACSSVFKAMFSNDMKEKQTDFVSIEDLSDDTIRRMLLFLYTASVEDFSWESASQLYVAADKYAILRLKNICSTFMKENLTPSNACEALLLADYHSDVDLKSFVQVYIIKNGKKITKSDEWQLLMQSNAKLAAETLCLVFK